MAEASAASPSPTPVRHDSHAPRTHTCGDLRPEHVGEDVVLKGWVDTRRDLGGVIFIDLRDRYGLTQIVFSPQDDAQAHEAGNTLRSEYVVSVKGVVQERSEDTINPKLPTGGVEVRVQDLNILNTAEVPPFTVSAHEQKRTRANEDLRLQHRFLDLRRQQLQENLRLRHRFYQTTRRYLDTQDFLEIETPVLMKSTPEGARDFLVPSRLHPGKFYALPQSPQTYKQICMVAGLDRYFQIVKCFRDEDLRADRQPEFTQVDIEMSFATEEQIYQLMEGHMAALWKELMDTEIPTPFPRMTYDEAMRTYGSDKPDTRFGLKIHDVSEAIAGSGFRVFDNIIDGGGHVIAIVVSGEGDQGRGYMDRLDAHVRKTIGAGGLVYVRLPSDGSAPQPSVKEHVVPTEYIDATLSTVDAGAGDLVLVLAGPYPTVFEQMGALRLHMARELDLLPEGNEGPWEFLWVTDFPLLEWDDDAQRYHAMHHPFTSPHAEDMAQLDTAPGEVRARAYDLVLNGTEIGGGSIRIHNAEVQQHMFSALGIDEAEAQKRFGFLLKAFRFGAPPHGGIALGLDRLVMLMAGASSLRDVIAFPKTQSAAEPMVKSPDVVDPEQLRDLHIRTVLPKTKDEA
ncbi:MAG: aspartate--tRNA ligase [Bacteroidetes bacterium]|jgi:aspartyl-tRNA synthetase|nr:aspartate--tRNA ligase [Bacteroidota bacterium]